MALLIGASEFEDPWLGRLAAPSGDLNSLQAVLADPRIGSFTVLSPLLNESETRIRRAVEQFFSSLRANDLALLYYSGHGLLDDHGSLYLAARDTARAALLSTAVAASFVSEMMDRSVCRHQILVLDCCHSGAFGKGAKAAVAASVGTSRSFEGARRGRAVLTASDATQFAWSDDDTIGESVHSTFTKHLIEGLKTGEADLDGDGRITLEELYGYVRDRVQDETSKQTPRLFKIRQTEDLVIGWNPRQNAVERRLVEDRRDATDAPGGPIEEIWFPGTVRYGADSEIRVRFGRHVSFVRVEFRYNEELLRIGGTDKVKDR